jgi:hypothetical protein
MDRKRKSEIETKSGKPKVLKKPSEHKPEAGHRKRGRKVKFEGIADLGGTKIDDAGTALLI